MPWIQAHLTVDQSQVALLELLLDKLGALSITLGDAGDEPMLEPLPGAMPLWTATRVGALFSADQDTDQLRSALDQALHRDISQHLSIEVLQDQDWARSWLQRFQPMLFGRRLWVCPSGRQLPDNVANQAETVRVDLDPGLAFGTGTHPTTALCLQWLDGTSLQGKTLVDFGCGSGILSIAALKLGATRVIGIDHDPQALVASRANAVKNGVADRLLLAASLDVSNHKADIILANILANVLIDTRQQLLNALNPRGELVMSGVLKDQVGQVAQHYSANRAVIQTQQQNDWCLLHVQQANACENPLP